MNAILNAAGDRQVIVPLGRLALQGMLAWPDHPSGLVLFAHGSGSGRLSPRNQGVARQLRAAGLATLLFDLLTPHEAEQRQNVFEIPLLAARLRAATDWAVTQPEVASLPVGYFGASTGAAAALLAASLPGARVSGVISRGGRPDLAGDALYSVRAPTLLIVGGRDEEVLELNRRAYRRLTCPKRLLVIPGATHLFEEPGALEAAGQAAAGWLIEHLVLVPRWRAARR
ncbi:MAG TPA: alpha/beta family hydrolase [Gemmatimonadales bacterium]|nr:alpha/beta family hydrolase [Gemmatimonadales bacterium]